MAMEELELTDAQAKALLESPSPLADVYRYFEKLETGDVYKRQDMDYMSQLTGKTKEALAGELQGVIFRVPGQLEQDGTPHYVTADEYLSGNVRPVSYTHLDVYKRQI